jgi:stage II sporulation protein D
MRMRLAKPGKIVLAKLAFTWIAFSVALLLSVSKCSPVLANNNSADSSAYVRVGVFGLFRPTQFRVSALQGSALILSAGDKSIVLEKSSGDDAAVANLTGDEIIVSAGTRVFKASKLMVMGRNNEPVDFVLAVPGKIARRYHGTLEMVPSDGTLNAIITMDCELAVASVVAAENTSDTPMEALKAQAVAARSYLVASHGRHHLFDFCDTTHCQFLRHLPPEESAAAKATAATKGLVLAYESQPIAAMYTLSCSGRTRTPADLGLSTDPYPYYSVECEYCRTHPARWSSRISLEDAAALRASNESARLAVDRRLGWSRVPSNEFVAKAERNEIVLQGIGRGHGIGLCQSGAKAMAREGSDFRQILSHYYPNTAVITLPAQSRSAHESQQSHLP